ncbi:MAG: hypothetical protein V4549_15895 [Bacteroidota bacterium]
MHENEIDEKHIETKEFYHSYMWLKGGIFFGKYKSNLIIDIQVAKDIIHDRRKMSNGITMPFLLDVTGLLCVDAPARKYMAGHEACEFLSAGAIYTHNKLLAFLGNAFILLDRPLLPAKVFTDKERALEWLEPFKYQN